MQIILTVAIALITWSFVGSSTLHIDLLPLLSKDKESKDILDVLSALGPTFIAAMTAYIAIQQWLTNEKSRKSQYFQKYNDNYMTVMKGLAFITQTAKVDMDTINHILTAKGEAALYLSKEIIDFTHSLSEDVIDLWVLQQEIESPLNEHERLALIDKVARLKKKIYAYSPQIIYRKYMILE